VMYASFHPLPLPLPPKGEGKKAGKFLFFLLLLFFKKSFTKKTGHIFFS
jgi:hypothetical protein